MPIAFQTISAKQAVAIDGVNYWCYRTAAVIKSLVPKCGSSFPAYRKELCKHGFHVADNECALRRVTSGTVLEVVYDPKTSALLVWTYSNSDARTSCTEVVFI